jgi:hypothetical protein
MRYIATALSLLLLLFGLLCLNFTKASNLPKHTQFAIEHDLPKPGEGILFTGAAAIMAGAGTLGYLAGTRPTSPKPGPTTGS